MTLGYSKMHTSSVLSPQVMGVEYQRHKALFTQHDNKYISVVILAVIVFILLFL